MNRQTTPSTPPCCRTSRPGDAPDEPMLPVAGLRADYESSVIDRMRRWGNQLRAGGLTLRLAAEFGFCYGVGNAIAYAYRARAQYPDRRIFLTNEIIHNPRVNDRLRQMGITILNVHQPDTRLGALLTAEDVVILPAFGVHVDLLDPLNRIGCKLIDTTCGSVMAVWKRVEKLVAEGFTAVIHGKYRHEETVATCSRVRRRDGHYLIVRSQAEAEQVCAYIRTRRGREELQQAFKPASSPGFRFDRHLERIGMANQTTMLSSESLRIEQMFREALEATYGKERVDHCFRSFGTICHSTQKRQDSVLEMMQHPPDLMIVVGGFNSSNTRNLSHIASRYCPTYHVDESDCLIDPNRIRHLPVGDDREVQQTEGWLPARRPLQIGLTGGASTPNRVIGEVIDKLMAWETTAGSIEGTDKECPGEGDPKPCDSH